MLLLNHKIVTMTLQPPLIGMDAEPFVPHVWEDVVAKRALPKEVSAPWYAAQIKAFEALKAEHLDAWRITYPGQAGRVTGLAVLPKERAETMPLVIFNRGGNREFGRLGVNNIVFPLADLARAGYAVLASNYRGNDGGEGTEEFGGAEVQDVLDLLALGQRQPWWNGTAYLLGWSRGGMMTYLALKQGAKVNAAATLAGLADLEAGRQVRPDMQSVYERLIPGIAANESAMRAALEARSAVCWPEALDTPLLLLHGDADNRVDVSHSTLLAERMARLHLEHRLVVYPAGTHSLSRYHKEVAAEVLGWFAAHA